MLEDLMIEVAANGGRAMGMPGQMPGEGIFDEEDLPQADRVVLAPPHVELEEDAGDEEEEEEEEEEDGEDIDVAVCVLFRYRNQLNNPPASACQDHQKRSAPLLGWWHKCSGRVFGRGRCTITG